MHYKVIASLSYLRALPVCCESILERCLQSEDILAY